MMGNGRNKDNTLINVYLKAGRNGSAIVVLDKNTFKKLN